MNNSLPFPVGCFVEVTKLSACRNPITEPGDWATYIIGVRNNRSLPIDYSMKGYLLELVTVGGMIDLHRIERNGVSAEGRFMSTLIVAIREGSLVETFNSVYRVVPRDSIGEESPMSRDFSARQQKCTIASVEQLLSPARTLQITR